MKRDDFMLLFLTFLTAVAIGMYVYIMFFKPTYVPDQINNSESVANEWSLISKRYSDGPSRTVEPSFRLLGDRTYVYLPGGQSEDSLTPIEGKLSSSLMKKVRQFDSSLAGYTMSSETGQCRSDLGGYDFEYRYIIDNTVYNLDTCDTSLGYTSSLSVTLEAVWDEIEKGRQIEYGSFSEWAEDWIRKNVGVE